MNIEKLASLLTLASLSLELHNAERAVRNAKTEYHNRLYELCEGSWETPCKQNKNADEDSTAYRLYIETQDEYAAFKAAKKKAYNVKRRWVTACRKSAS